MNERKLREKDYGDILKEELDTGASEYARPASGLLLSGCRPGWISGSAC